MSFVLVGREVEVEDEKNKIKHQQNEPSEKLFGKVPKEADGL